MDSHVARFEFGFRVDDNHVGYDVQHVTSGHLLDRSTEVLQRYSQLVRIELGTTLLGVMFRDQSYQFAADFFLTVRIVVFRGVSLID